MAATTCYQCDDEITLDRFEKWHHTHGTPRNGHYPAPEMPADIAAYFANRRSNEGS